MKSLRKRWYKTKIKIFVVCFKIKQTYFSLLIQFVCRIAHMLFVIQYSLFAIGLQSDLALPTGCPGLDYRGKRTERDRWTDHYRTDKDVLWDLEIMIHKGEWMENYYVGDE